MEFQIRVAGGLMVGLALLHVGFPRYFEWAGELQPLRLINRQMMYVHTLFIGLAVLLMGLLCIGYAPELVRTPLGRVVTLGFGIFWLVRLVVQFFVYSTELWRGKRFETVVHIIFSLLWTYLTGLFFAVFSH
ncbi:hypothetical protein F0P96_01580 [Hymenobacter busanensis]|uniref:Uncharacterized protein n=1 Tax=Hymenobacter busanensis TaxID=2607656 RepID=A0A7L4ZVN2_9BACT|nr:hypothetical protein [Hymenobacter busanensis]KAA9339343.1 hypothetical protein F0P96_01580 [Hymenobacter busanensis]QHJ06895.1 hypothetical protein GUY19_06170 [Hymenobacter busanensis]